MKCFASLTVLKIGVGFAMVCSLFGPTARAAASGGSGVASLQCDSLTEPLGIDDASPTFSWKLLDATAGARQTAYRIEVFSAGTVGGAVGGPAAPDVWDSGKVRSSAATGITYQGPKLQPSTRYFWQVEVWGKEGKPYPVSSRTWWETGLLDQAALTSQWIGYESPELHRLRNSSAQWITNPEGTAPMGKDTLHAFRTRFTLNKPVQSAVLYTTGEDTATAWVNGYKVLSARPNPPWGRTPWMTYERQDVTAQMTLGENTLAIQITHYGPGPTTSNETPMSACLSVVYADGSTELHISDTDHWKAALNAVGAWWGKGFNDSAWSHAQAFPLSTNASGEAEDVRPWPTGPVALLRRAFDVKAKVVSARLYATALGAYKFRINGKVIGDQILAPGWMDFREHISYQVYDVTAEVREGSNVMGAYLAAGWYATPLKWSGEGNNYGNTQPALRAQLRLQRADGSVQWIATDDSWKGEPSEILKAEIYDGETRDERKVERGWDSAGFDAGAWHPVTVVSPKEPKLLAQFFPPIREERVMKAKAITSPAAGVYILDFGQNMSAVPLLHVKGQRGDAIQLRFAEVLNTDGTLYVENLRNAKATDHYLLAGGGDEGFQPEFTFHGFRYMEVTGLRKAPTAETLQAVVLHTDAPFTMQFETGNAMVNQLWSNVLWGQRSNFVGLPTDCPQRDERLGWTADAQVFWRTAAFNMDLNTFTRKFSTDLRGTQVGTSMYGIFAPGVDASNPGYGAAWSDAGVIIPWSGWMQSGDRRIVDENWDGMVQYIAQIEAGNSNHLWQKNFGTPFGDWLSPTIATPEDLLATAYWAYDVEMMRQMAVATGRTAEAQRYAALHEAIRLAFEKAYVRDDGTVGTVDHYPSIPAPTNHPETGDANHDKFVETQTGYVLALHMGLVPEPLRAAAAKRLVAMLQQNHWLLGTGFLGTPYLLEVLSRTGYSDVAYRLLLNTEYPSWGYLIEHGATTTWERWNGDQMRGDPSMNSYNHYAYGAVAEWMYRFGAGIDTTPTDAGFREIVLHPNFDARLRSLKLDYDSQQGVIHSDWQVDGAQVTWNVTVPANTRAILQTALINAEAFQLGGEPLESNAGIQKISDDEYELPSGSYTFKAKLKVGADPQHEVAADARPSIAR
jgi:alpha-L-rhamnosidase